MEKVNEKMMPLDLEELEHVTGGMSIDVLDMQTLNIKLESGESAAGAVNDLLANGVSFLFRKIKVSDEKGMLHSAAAALDANKNIARSCTIRYRLSADLSTARILDVKY